MRYSFILFIFLIAAIPASLKSQDISVGINGGVSFSVPKDSPGKMLSDLKSMTVGMIYQQEFNKHLAYSVSFNYLKTGYSEVVTNYSPLDPQNDLYQNLIRKDSYHFSYLSVPVIFRPYLGNKFRIYGNLGFETGFLLNGTHDYFQYALPFDPNYSENGSYSISENLNHLRFGIVYGLGFGYALNEHLSVGGDFCINNPLNTFGDQEYDIPSSTRTIRISLMYRFNEQKLSSRSSVSDSIKVGKHSIYVEGFGNTNMLYAINYLYVLKQYRLSYTYVTAGFGFEPSKNDFLPVYGFPVSINMAKGRKRHFLELGTGITWSINGSQSISSDELRSSKAVFSTMRVGYKFQPHSKGIYTGIGLTGYGRLKEYGDTGESSDFYVLPGARLGYFF